MKEAIRCNQTQSARFKSSGRCTYLIGEAISIAISVAMRVAITMPSDDARNHDGV
jgi:hypothetical protein